MQEGCKYNFVTLQETQFYAHISFVSYYFWHAISSIQNVNTFELRQALWLKLLPINSISVENKNSKMSLTTFLHSHDKLLFTS